MIKNGEFSQCYMTAEDLLAELQIPEDDEAHDVIMAHAYGYIAAVVDAHTIFHCAEGFPPVFEFPNCKFGAVASAIEQDLMSDPHLADASAASLVIRALQRHFPSPERATEVG